MLNVRGTIEYMDKVGEKAMIQILEKREKKQLIEMYKELMCYEIDINKYEIYHIRTAIIEKLRKIKKKLNKIDKSY